MELLDVLCGGDEPLSYALLCFNSIEHARCSVWMQVQEGVIAIYEKTPSHARVLPLWEVRNVLAEEKWWREPSATNRFWFCIIEKGLAESL